MAEIKLINRDCLLAMAEMKDKSFDLAIVDPPYGIGRAGHALSLSVATKKQWHKFYEDKQWDNTIPSMEYFNEIVRVSKNQIIWGGNYFTEFLKPSRGWVFWYKEQNGLSMSDGEMAWTSFDCVTRQFSLHRTHLWQEGTTHPTQKPVKLYEWLLKNYAKPGDRILDTHGGSMSIAIACYNLDFDLTLYEIDADYYKAGVQRLEEHKKQIRLFGEEKS